MTEKTMIAVADADRKQLAYAAKNVHNLQFNGRDIKAEELRELLTSINVTEIEVDGTVQGDSDNTPPTGAQGTTSPAEEGEKPVYTKAKIKIFVTEKDKAPVPLGVNGKLMYVPRDKEVEIPIKFYHALDDAKHIIYEKGSGKVGDDAIKNPQKVHRYPHSVIAFS